MDQDTDQLLIASLSQFGFDLQGKQIKNLQDIDGDILRLICFQFLEYVGSSVTLASMKGQQKFRQSSKIAEEMKNLYNLRIDINSLLSPQKDDIRKILLAILQKLSMHEEGGETLNISIARLGVQSFDSFQDKVNFLKDQKRKNILRKWVKEEWVHPYLSNAKYNQFRCYDQEISLVDRYSLRKKPIICGNIKRSNLYACLVNIIEQDHQLAKINTFLKENYYADEYVKNNQERHAQQLISLKNQVVNEYSNNNNKKVNKIAKQFLQEDEQENYQKVIVQDEFGRDIEKIVPLDALEQEKTIFNKEILLQQEIEEKKQGNQSSDVKDIQLDIESLKKKHEEDIQALVSQLDEYNSKLEKYEQKRQKMETNIQQNNEQGELLKQKNIGVQKEIQNMDLLIKELESKGGNSELAKEIKEIQEEIQQMEEQWNEYQNTEVKQLDEMKNELETKREKIEMIKDKSRRIDQEYSELIADIKNNYEKKEKLVEDYKRMPQGGNRQQYVKKITEIKKNYDKQKGEMESILKDVKEIEEAIQYQQNALDRHGTEFENFYNNNSKKNESLSKQIFKIYQEYRAIMDKTINNLREIGAKKIETRNIEGKISQLSQKHYDKSMEKLQQDIEEIKQENILLQKNIK